MSRKATVLAKGGKGGDKPCKWKNCDKKHKFKIIYPNDGIVKRKGLSDWSHPSVYSDKGIIMPEFQKDILSIKDANAAGAYKYQRHHVIPCAVYSDLKKLSFNLKLIGYDINNEVLNGISLPTKPKDIVWHDLQYHRGYHKAYNATVLNSMKNLEKTILKKCVNDEQGDLWDEVQKKVKYYKTNIIKWKIPLFPDSFAQRARVFNKIGITIPES